MTGKFPQLRVRSGYSYRNAYGRFPEIIERLKDVGAESAALVDHGTWGHVRFEQAMLKAGLKPMFGMEIPVIHYDEEGEETKEKPVAWVLARNTRSLYRLTSQCTRNKGLNASELCAAACRDVIRFVGGAHSLPYNAYDYVDVNPSSFSHAYKSVLLARKANKPMVITSYNDLPHPDFASFAYSWEVRDSVGMRHIASVDELWSNLQHVMTREEFDAAVSNTLRIAEELADVRLQKAPLISLDGDLAVLAREGQVSRLQRGHIVEWTDEYEARFVMEMEQIKNKKFDSYFLVVSDLIRFAKQHMLVGPARGSSAGSLICYLLGITEVDPIPHKLLFYRFIDISRSDFPDIDIDFSDTKRYMVFDYLQEKYGRWNVCKLGNINTLKAASVLAQVGKRFGIGYDDTQQVRNSLIEYSSADERYGKGLEDTMSKTVPGQSFRAKYPEAAACMGDIELHPSHSGVHAAGILVCNDEITEYCTINEEGVAQLDKPDSEYLNLLKIDALGLRTLGVIEDAGVVTADELYSLKLDDPKVLEVLNLDKVSGIFQFEGDAVRSVTRSVYVDKFEKIDHLTALARPGPLSSGMAQKYIERAAGRSKIEYVVPEMEKFLHDTFGVFLYQEQIMSVVKDLGNFDWEQTSAIRKAMSGRKGEEFFNKRREIFVAGAATHGISAKDATAIWNEMVTFGAWGFNRSHSVSYAIVTYWTLWMKCYHKLEYAAASLRAAKDDEQTIAILRELDREGVRYTPIDPDFSDMNWKVADGRLVGGIQNAKGYGAVKAMKYVQAREAGLLTDKQRESLRNAEVKFSDLREAHTKFGEYYARPELAGVTSGSPIVNMDEVEDGEDALVIGKLTKKVLADENEPIRQKKREERGKARVYKGQSQFIDLMMVDDSTDAAMRFRIRPEKFLSLGKPIAEGDPLGSWYLIKGWKLSGIDMFIVKNIKKIDPPVAKAEVKPSATDSEDFYEIAGEE